MTPFSHARISNIHHMAQHCTQTSHQCKGEDVLITATKQKQAGMYW